MLASGALTGLGPARAARASAVAPASVGGEAGLVGEVREVDELRSLEHGALAEGHGGEVVARELLLARDELPLRVVFRRAPQRVRRTH